ncbi:MAG: hypothetical protein ACRESK_05775 [Gammaproteobacteria bacterium]
MLKNFYNTLVQYMKTNARDNLDIRTGWRRRVQDIYVACHRRENPPAAGSPPNLWQHYAEKK